VRFYVSNRVRFLVVDSSTFIEMIRALRPAFVERTLVPNRKNAEGPGLTTLYSETRKEVLSFLPA